MEDMILGAEDKLVQLEYELFRELREQIAKKCGPYPENSKGIGKDRCVCLLGTDFRTEPLLPSVIKPEWRGSILKNGRHPVVEKDDKQ